MRTDQSRSLSRLTCPHNINSVEKKSRASNLTCSKYIYLVDWMDNKQPNAVSTCSKKDGWRQISMFNRQLSG